MITTREKKSLQKKFDKMSYNYDPWKQQIVIETTTGECIIELMRSDREFHLFKVEQHNNVDVTGLENIKTRVADMINSGNVVDIYVDYL